jgi:hypothetical protein
MACPVSFGLALCVFLRFMACDYIFEAVQPSIKEIMTGTKGSGISDQLRNMSFN